MKYRLINTRHTREKMFQHTTFGKMYTEVLYRIEKRIEDYRLVSGETVVSNVWRTRHEFWKSSVDDALEYFNEYVTEEKRKYEESQLESIIIAEEEF